MGKNVGYIRVSSASQNTDRQLKGLALDNTFTDNCSVADARRPRAAEFAQQSKALSSALTGVDQGVSYGTLNTGLLKRPLSNRRFSRDKVNGNALGLVYFRKTYTSG